MSESRLVPDFEARIASHAARIAREEATERWVREVVPAKPKIVVNKQRRGVEAILKLHPDWSNRTVATACRVSHTSVLRYREHLVDGGQLPAIARRQCADGRSYPVAGKPTSSVAARRERIETMLVLNPIRSDRGIAIEAKVDRLTVRKIRRRLVASGQIPDCLNRVKINGLTYTRITT